MKSSPFNITVIACDVVNNGESTSIYGLGEKQQDFMTSPLQDSNTVLGGSFQVKTDVAGPG